MNRIVCIVIACAALILSAQSASAEATYRYTGSLFALFSCGLDSNNHTRLCPTPAPANPLTSYTATDFVSITLSFDDPLPPNFPSQVVLNRPGFRLTMSDGQQTLTEADAIGLTPYVSTDASGQINTWQLHILTADPHRAIKSSSSYFEDTGILAFGDPSVSVKGLVPKLINGDRDSPCVQIRSGDVTGP